MTDTALDYDVRIFDIMVWYELEFLVNNFMTISIGKRSTSSVGI